MSTSNQQENFQDLWTKAETKWNQALATYRQQTGRDLKHIDTPKPQSVDDLGQWLNKQDDSFNTSRGRGQKFFDAMKMAFVPLGFISNMFGGIANQVFAPSTQILGAITVLVNAGQSVSNSYDAISGLFEKIGSATSRLKVLTREQVDAALADILVDILVAVLDTVALVTRRCSEIQNDKKKHYVHSIGDRLSQYFRVLVAGQDGEINDAVARLDKLVDQEERMTIALIKDDTSAVRSEQSAGLERQDAGFNRMDEGIERQDEGFKRVDEGFKRQDEGLKRQDEGFKRQDDSFTVIGNKIEIMQNTLLVRLGNMPEKKKETEKVSTANEPTRAMKQARQLQELLKPEPANTDIYQKTKSERQQLPVIGDWIKSEPSFTEWRDRKTAMLLIDGEQGVGKSFLSSKLIDIVEDHLRKESDRSLMSVTYFFCKSHQNELKSTDAILRTVAYQAAQQDRSYARYILSLDKAGKLDTWTIRDVDQLWQLLFVDFFGVECQSKLYLVLDGIDELRDSDRARLLEKFKDCIPSKGSERIVHIQACLTSDNDLSTEISESLGAQIIPLHLDSSRNRNDVKTFVRHRIDLAFGHKLLSDALREQIVTKLASESGGNFLWASLVVEEITSKHREDTIRRTLSQLPQSLSAAVQLVLDRYFRVLDDDDVEDLQDVLAWVISAHRYLSIANLDSVLTVRSTDGSRVLDLEDLIQNRHSSLFAIVKAGGQTGGTSAEKIQRRLGKEEINTEDDTNEKIMSPIEKTPTGSTKEQMDNEISEETLQRWQADVVRLGHVAIAEYLQGTEQRGHRQLLDSLLNMQSKVLLGCLEVFGDVTKYNKAGTLVSVNGYCALFIPEHLKDLNRAAVDLTSKCAVVEALVKLFRDEDTAYRWVTAAASCLKGDVLDREEFLDDVLAWCRDEDVYPRLSTENRKWIDEASEKRLEVLLSVLAHCHARDLLETRDDNNFACFIFLRAYLAKMESREIEPVDEDALTVSAEEVIHIISWAGLSETATWHARTASILRRSEHIDEALKHYERSIAIERSPNTLEGMAMALSSNGNNKAAILTMLESLALTNKENFPALSDADVTDTMLSNYDLLADYYEAEGQVDDFLDAVAKAAMHYRSLGDVMVRYLKALMSEGRLDEASQAVLNYANADKQRFLNISDIYDTMIWDSSLASSLQDLATKTKSIEAGDVFYKKGLRSVAMNGDDGETSVIRYYHASFLLRCSDQHEARAMDLLNEMREDSEIATSANMFHNLREQASLLLARFYLSKAIYARDHEDWADIGKYAHALYQLLRPESDEADLNSSAQEAVLQLAVWYKIIGLTYRTRVIAKPFIRAALNLLTDDDLTNDIDAFYMLSHGFLALGELDTAKSLMSFVKQAAISTEVEEVADGEEGNGDVKEDEDGVEQAGNDIVADTDEPQATHSNVNGTIEEDAQGAGDGTSNIPDQQAAAGAQQTGPHSQADPLPDAVAVNGTKDAEQEVDGTFADKQNRVLTKGIDGAGSEYNTKQDAPPADKALAAAPEEPGTIALDDDVAKDELYAEKEDAIDENALPASTSTPEEPTFLEVSTSGSYSCDGPCRDTIPVQKAHYRCRYCINMDFCEDDYALLKKGEIRNNICGATHEHIRVEGVEERYPKGMIKMAGEHVELVVWIAELKKEWLD